jgi:hypothetical protein
MVEDMDDDMVVVGRRPGGVSHQMDNITVKTIRFLRSILA